MKKCEKAVEKAWDKVTEGLTNEAEKKFVYVVSSGYYSDYHIEAIFSTEEQANDFVEWRKMLPFSDEYDVEKFPIDSLFRNYTMINYVFEYHSKTNILSATMVRRNMAGPEEFILVVDGHSFQLSPNVRAVKEYLMYKKLDLITKIAQDKAAELEYNDEFLKEDED